LFSGVCVVPRQCIGIRGRDGQGRTFETLSYMVGSHPYVPNIATAAPGWSELRIGSVTSWVQPPPLAEGSSLQRPPPLSLLTFPLCRNELLRPGVFAPFFFLLRTDHPLFRQPLPFPSLLVSISTLTIFIPFSPCGRSLFGSVWAFFGTSDYG
jgi:hypothetical protein